MGTVLVALPTKEEIDPQHCQSVSSFIAPVVQQFRPYSTLVFFAESEMLNRIVVRAPRVRQGLKGIISSRQVFSRGAAAQHWSPPSHCVPSFQPLALSGHRFYSTPAPAAEGTLYKELTVGCVKETLPREKRVALTPANVELLLKEGFKTVLVESGAGAAAGFLDSAYKKAGAQVLPRVEAIKADIVVKCREPTVADIEMMNSGATLISIVKAKQNPEVVNKIKEKKLTVFAMEQIPRTISRAQAFDVLSSQTALAKDVSMFQVMFGLPEPEPDLHPLFYWHILEMKIYSPTIFFFSITYLPLLPPNILSWPLLFFFQVRRGKLSAVFFGGDLVSGGSHALTTIPW